MSTLHKSGHRPSSNVTAHAANLKPKWHRSASVLVVLRLRTTPIYDIAHFAKYKDRESRHALPLFWTKRFVEWLPRLGEFIQIG
jgi:hypothetical protein